MKTFIDNLITLVIYTVMFGVVLSLYFGFNERTFFTSVVLALFFGILNELHRDLVEIKDILKKKNGD